MHMFVVFLGTCVGLNFTCVDLFHIVVILCDIFLHVSCVVFGTSVVHSRVASQLDLYIYIYIQFQFLK